jgi:hypothetical protein
MIINQTVNVNAFYFKNGPKLKSFPRQVQMGGTAYTFLDGLQYLVQKGTHIIRLFDMTDGRTTFRLKLEDDEWTLLSTRTEGAV